MQSPDATLALDIVASSPAGILVCDARLAGWPVVYANEAFARATGHTEAELAGQLLDTLPQASGADTQRVLLRGGSGEVTHCVVFRHVPGPAGRDDEASQPASLPAWQREDRASGVHSRAWFELLLAREWQVARREARPLTLLLFDIDALAAYNDTFGRAAGDAIIRRVAHTVSGAFRRGNDLVGRWEEGTIAVLAGHKEQAGVEPVVGHARRVVERVAALHLHHPRSPGLKIVTVTAAAATLVPAQDEEGAARLVTRATEALDQGKLRNRNALTVAQA